MRVDQIIADGEKYSRGLRVSKRVVCEDGLAAFLERLPGVTGVSRAISDGGPRAEARITFEVDGVPSVVWDAFGTNSEYWILALGRETVLPRLAEITQALEDEPARPWWRLVCW